VAERAEGSATERAEGPLAERVRGSVVIPAHDEREVIGRCLDALLDGVPLGALEILVACNGCTDGTADLVRSGWPTVRVIEIAEASKTAALQAADTVARAFPRLYLDADVVLPGSSALDVLELLAGGTVLAARPPLRYDTRSCTRLVRRYHAARVRVPALLDRLWGAGVYGLSAQGRARFGAWPPVLADDLFVDSLFTNEEIAIVATEPVVVSVPRTAPALLAVLRRGIRAKSTHRHSPALPPGEPGAGAPGPGGPVPGSLRLSHRTQGTLGGLLRAGLRRPVHLPDVLVFAGFAFAARVPGGTGSPGLWERDDSSRALC